MNPTDEITGQLQDAAARLKTKGLFGRQSDRLSMRIPGSSQFAWMADMSDKVQISSSDDDNDSPLHPAVYFLRPDAGAVLCSTTDWSRQLSELRKSPPTLFDEQARHIGNIAAPVAAGDLQGLLNAIRRGSNVAIYGPQCIRIGMTKDRVVFNAELFEKCATAFVIATSTGKKLRTIPGWVRFIAGRRLQKDQRRAAASYRQGQIPQGMNAY